MIGHLIFTKVVKTSIAFNILRIDAFHIKLYIRRRLYPAIESVRGRRSDERNFSLLFSFFPPFFHARTHATTQIARRHFAVHIFYFIFRFFGRRRRQWPCQSASASASAIVVEPGAIVSPWRR